MINVEVEKNSNENNVNVLRRFTKRVQGAGILSRVRSIRYSGRKQSKLAVKKRALKRIKNRGIMEDLAKLGKLPEKKVRGRK